MAEVSEFLKIKSFPSTLIQSFEGINYIIIIYTGCLSSILKCAYKIYNNYCYVMSNTMNYTITINIKIITCCGCLENYVDGYLLTMLPNDFEEFKTLVPQAGLRMRLKEIILKEV